MGTIGRGEKKLVTTVSENGAQIKILITNCFWGNRTAARDEGGTGCAPGGEAARRPLARSWWWRQQEAREGGEAVDS
jgi:hypothetical protein